AVDAAGRADRLTTVGMAVGTPAYMAPEQAAGDPHLDHRADLYATGVLAYEMLTGRLPFGGTTPQAMLAAHVTEVPDPIERHRPAVPPGLATLVMRCLEKKPADRWQRADELSAALDTVATSGASTPWDTAPVSVVRPADLAAQARRGQPARVALWFGAAALAILALVYLVVQLAGLPDWVLAVAATLLAIGFPIMLATGLLERRRAQARATGVPTATPTAGLPALVTWRRALLGGGVGFVALGLVTGGWVVTRAMGVGPAGTLLTSGALDEHDRLVIAQFANRTPDSTLTRTVTELFRIGMSQSPVVKLVSEQAVVEILQRMQRPPDAQVDEAMAREIVEREGFKAYVAGEIAPVGSGYLVSARLLTPAGDILTAQQVSAADDAGIIAAVDELSARIRERVGESLRTIRRTGPLDKVTTGSLEALRLYAQGLAAENAGDDQRALGLFERAVALDTGFAMGYRKIGTILGNNFEERDRAVAMLTRAYDLRDRLSDRERAYAEGMYYSRVMSDPDRTIAAYRTLLEKYPDDYIALNNMGVAYYMSGDLERAVEAYRRGIEADSSRVLSYGNLAGTQAEIGQLAAAESTLAALEARFPGNQRGLFYRHDIAYAQGDYETTERLSRQIRDLMPGPMAVNVTHGLVRLLILRGRLAEAESEARHALTVAADRGMATDYLDLTVDLSIGDLLRGQPAAGRARLDAALERFPPDRIPLLDRPYGPLVHAFTAAGDIGRAREYLRDWEASGRTAQPDDARWFRATSAGVAMAERRYDDALDNIRAFGTRYFCRACVMMLSATAHDGAGRPDSALAYWEAYATTPQRMLWWDFADLPRAYKRLGELYEARGDRQRAVDWYARFTDVWAKADPALQPVVEDVRRRIQRLTGERSE
ncbi:MAG TPA: tetratricopeptide repeat protein, partial [Gemmatimonadales bacterium]|nr:tetratricopeptide repeat protein [Gemmatimonadales bacterium]